MYDHIKNPMPVVLVMEQMMMANYPLSPHVHFDQCDPKRQKVLLENPGNGSIASQLFDAQMAVTGAFREFHFVYATGAGQTPFHYLAGQYGSLQKRFKELTALIKKYSKQDEVASYFFKASTAILPIPLYDIMKSDFELMAPVFAARRAHDIKRFPDFDMWEPLEIDWEVANKNFKDAK